MNFDDKIYIAGHTGMVGSAIKRKLQNLGYTNFIFPKINHNVELDSINKVLSSIKSPFKYILLVESPSLLISLHNIVDRHLEYISAIGFGSHDYCNRMNMKPSFFNTNYAKYLILNIGKAFNLTTIDTPSMELNNERDFEDECISSKNMGFDGKFILHPWQLNILNSAKYYSDCEVEEAVEIMKILKQKNNEYEFIKHNNKIYEHPHINRLKYIYNWHISRTMPEGS